jgi:mannonate dehydratase
MEDGYYDMFEIMKALHDVSYDGTVILDHSPNLLSSIEPMLRPKR